MRGESHRVAVESVNSGWNSYPVNFSAPIVQLRPVRTVNTVSAFIKHPKHLELCCNSSFTKVGKLCRSAGVCCPSLSGNCFSSAFKKFQPLLQPGMLLMSPGVDLPFGEKAFLDMFPASQ